ncbi:MAG TPA: hypothetical protein VM031_06905, partial [Phycisphaerae bacterium]|nr:hypothetical protein [Phycisphaerae bacterium]
MTRSTGIGLAAALLFQAGATGAEWYVSPGGQPAASGTKGSPWDLASTLEGKRRVRPGDTVWLLGG